MTHSSPVSADADDYEKRIREKVWASECLSAGEWVYLVGLFQMSREAKDGGGIRAQRTTRRINRPEDICKDCGLARREHHHDGAAYGVCGQFSEVAHTPAQQTTEPIPQDAITVAQTAAVIIDRLTKECAELRAQRTPLPGLVETLRSHANDCEDMERWATPELAPLLRRAADVIEGGVSAVTSPESQS